MRMRTLETVVVLVMFASVLGSDSAALGSTSASKNATAHALSPTALVAASIAAADAEPSVRDASVASVTGSIQVRGTADVGSTTGSQVATITLGNQTGHAKVLLVDHVAYVKADALSLRLLLGLTATAASHEANRWIKITTSSKVYASTLDGLTVRSTMSEIVTMQGAKELPEQTILGERVIPIVGTTKSAPGIPSTRETVYVRATGLPLPVELRQSASVGQSSESFSSWGEQLSVHAPSGAIAISPSWLQKP
jgi:hypothetical protein